MSQQGDSRAASFYECSALLVIFGHYGSGKTNLALNLAKKLKALGRRPTLVDLDVVNPYFRSTDYQDLTDAEGIRVTGPVFGNSNLDAPSLAPGIDALITEATLDCPVILDVGGDPDGARALVRYTPAIAGVTNKLVMLVVNTRRPETQSIEGNLAMLHNISATSSLAIDALIGNTHLAEFTTMDTIEQSVPLLRELSEASGLPLLAVTVPEYVESIPSALQEDSIPVPLLVIERLVKTNWQ